MVCGIADNRMGETTNLGFECVGRTAMPTASVTCQYQDCWLRIHEGPLFFWCEYDQPNDATVEATSPHLISQTPKLYGMIVNVC